MISCRNLQKSNTNSVYNFLKLSSIKEGFIPDPFKISPRILTADLVMPKTPKT